MLNTMMESEKTTFAKISIPFLRSHSLAFCMIGTSFMKELIVSSRRDVSDKKLLNLQENTCDENIV